MCCKNVLTILTIQIYWKNVCEWEVFYQFFSTTNRGIGECLLSSKPDFNIKTTSRPPTHKLWFKPLNYFTAALSKSSLSLNLWLKTDKLLNFFYSYKENLESMNQDYNLQVYYFRTFFNCERICGTACPHSSSDEEV